MRLKMKVEMKEEIQNETSVIDRGPAGKKVAVPLIAYLTTYLHTRPDCILVMQVVVVAGQGRPWSNDHLRLGLTHTHTLAALRQAMTSPGQQHCHHHHHHHHHHCISQAMSQKYY